MQVLQRNTLDVSDKESAEQNYPALSSGGCKCYTERSAGWISTDRRTIDQSIEWKTSLYVNFFDFEKAFDSLDQSILWFLTRHGIPGI